MKLLVTLLLLAVAAGHAQQAETFDIATFQPPKGWQRQDKGGVVIFNTSDTQKGTYAIITVFRSGTSTGNAKSDFEGDWAEFIAGQYAVKGKPAVEPIEKKDGWDVVSGGAAFENEVGPSAVILNTYSGFGKTFSAAAIFNSQDNLPAIEAFAASIKLKKTEAIQQVKSNPPAGSQTKAASNGFAFTTSNFDDGWNSVVNEDWVEVTKGNIKVLLHYPNAVTGKYYPDSDEGIKAAWNNLIAPRYNGLQNYTAWYSAYILPRPYLVAGNTTDKQSGKNVYVVLFQKGNTGWIEIISPDKNTFINNFGVDNTTLDHNPDSKLFASLEKLADYNKFAIAATDLKGKWSDNYTGTFFTYNAGDGQYAGTKTIGIVINFTFTSATAYNWDGYSTNNVHSAGSAKTFKTKGSFKMINNWQIQFSDIQGKPKTYNAYFSCFKGGRLLWLQDKDYGGYAAYGKVK